MDINGGPYRWIDIIEEGRDLASLIILFLVTVGTIFPNVSLMEKPWTALNSVMALAVVVT
jgi:hypothetical protein